MTNLQTKFCVGCNQELSIDNFYLQNGKSYKGKVYRKTYSKLCLECIRQYHKNRNATPKPIIPNLENEEWKDLIGYEGLYQISNYGRVKSIERVIISKKAKREVKSRIVKPYDHSGGYIDYVLFKDGEKKHIYAHRLVAQHFLQNPNNLPEVNHKDFDKRNNHVLNLEWCTASENITHYHRGKKFVAV